MNDPLPASTSTVRIVWLIVAAAGLLGAGFAVGHATANHPDRRDHERMRKIGRGEMHASTKTKPSSTPMDIGSMDDVTVESEDAYLAEMIPHHQEAIDSAKLLERRTDNPELKAFARSIVSGQSAEVRDMKAWRARWYPDSDVGVDYHQMMRDDLAKLEGTEFEQAFLEDMIQHHMMAVHMSHALLRERLARHDEVRTLAENIVDLQHQEILSMHDWLA